MPLGPDHGRLLIRTRREGFAQKIGHDLTLEITRWVAEIVIPDGDPKPYSAFFGALKLRDEVEVELDVTLPST
jgi:hypothetical protein